MWRESSWLPLTEVVSVLLRHLRAGSVRTVPVTRAQGHLLPVSPWRVPSLVPVGRRFSWETPSAAFELSVSLSLRHPGISSDSPSSQEV